MKDIPDYSNKDEIDLVDILAVLIKRKWFIITLIAIAFIISALYVYFSKKSYIAKIIITSPQEYGIGENRLLSPSCPELDEFLNKINRELSIKSLSRSADQKVHHFTYEANIIKVQTGSKPLNINVSGKQINIIYNEQEEASINIQITGQKEKIEEALKSVYTLFIDFQNEMNKNNQKIFKQNQDALQSIILQKREMHNTIMSFFEERTILKLPQGTEGAVLNSLIALDSTITDLEETKEVNKSVQLMKGDFAIVRGDLKISIDKNNLASIASYISPEKSKKRQLLPVIVSVFLAFFVGVFLAFVIEFFSREDVKRKLREIKNR